LRWWDESAALFVEKGSEFSFQQVSQAGDNLLAGTTRDVCILLFDRDWASVAAYLGCLRAGVVPLLVESTASAEDLGLLVRSFDPRYLFSNRGKTLPSFKLRSPLGDGGLYENIQSVPKDIDQSLAILQPTSGSTGEPKCVRVSYRNLEVAVASIAGYLDIDFSRTLISSLPFHYTYGLSLLHLAIFAGCKIVLTEHSALTRDFWEIFTSNKVTDFSGVPIHFEALARKGLPESAFESLRVVTQAGGGLAPEITAKWLDTLEERKVRFFSMYGQTEACPRISFVPPEVARNKLGSAGIAVPGARISISASEPDRVGEVIFEGPNVCLGYASSFDDLRRGDDFCGRLSTGDLGYMDSDGYLFIVGRLKRAVKVAGISVNLDSIERKAQGAGHRIAVVGRDGQIAVVFEGSNLQDLKTFVFESLRVPRQLVSFVPLPQLPTFSSGKIDYQTISALVFDKEAS
jgi:acyl-CoA synthetase (AMP-forming)/AMP-acid ligase II